MLPSARTDSTGTKYAASEAGHSAVIVVASVVGVVTAVFAAVCGGVAGLIEGAEVVWQSDSIFA